MKIRSAIENYLTILRMVVPQILGMFGVFLLCFCALVWMKIEFKETVKHIVPAEQHDARPPGKRVRQANMPIPDADGMPSGIGWEQDDWGREGDLPILPH